MSPTHQELSNDTTFSQIKSRVPVPLTILTYLKKRGFQLYFWKNIKLSIILLSIVLSRWGKTQFIQAQRCSVGGGRDFSSKMPLPIFLKIFDVLKVHSFKRLYPLWGVIQSYFRFLEMFGHKSL